MTLHLISQGLQETKQSDVSNSGKQSGLSQSLDSNSDSSSCNMSIEASLQGKPQRSSWQPFSTLLAIFLFFTIGMLSLLDKFLVCGAPECIFVYYYQSHCFSS